MGLEVLEPRRLSEFDMFLAERILEDVGLEVFGSLHLEFPEDPVAAERFAGLILGGRLKEHVLGFVGEVCREAIKHLLGRIGRLKVEVERFGNLEGQVRALQALKLLNEHRIGYVGYPPRLILLVGGFQGQPKIILCHVDVYSRDPAMAIPLGREALNLIPAIEEAAKNVKRTH